MRILIVEDETDLQATLEQALAEAGMTPEVAGNGEEALQKALEREYDAVILDVMLPGIDGWTVLEKLRRTRKTPVLMLTARDSIGDRVRGLDSGADDYLVKPFDLDELLARLRALLRRAVPVAEPNPEIIVIGALQLNTATKTATLDGAPVELTAREYLLMERLAMDRGKVLSRQKLLGHLYGNEDVTLSNLLEVHVCNIRRKLGKDYITTRRGHGYVIEKI